MEKKKEKAVIRYLALGLTIFCAGTALIMVYMSMSKYNSFVHVFNKGLMIISPFIYGIVIAYLLDPLYELIRKPLHWLLAKQLNGKYHPKIVSGVSGGIAVLLTMMAFIAFLTGFGFLVIPQVIDSLSSLVVIIPARAQEIIDFIEEQDASSNGMLMDTLIEWVKNSTDNITSWINNTILPTLGNYMTQIYQGLWSTVKTVLNIAIGMITSIYLMADREHFKATIKKAVRAIWPKNRADDIIDILKFTNKAFGGFISGKVVDSIIIGILCFLILNILNIPYAVLVSVIVGITNVIPFFGPFIGAIPGALIIGVADPMKMLIFLIVILALQQFDGYILGPKILGDSTGLSSFWVMFAIIVGGGLFGFLGMFFAVPTFAVITYYFNKRINRSLVKKGLPTETEAYENDNGSGGGLEMSKNSEDEPKEIDDSADEPRISKGSNGEPEEIKDSEGSLEESTGADATIEA